MIPRRSAAAQCQWRAALTPAQPAAFPLRLEARSNAVELVVGTNSAGEFFVEAALFADIFHCDAVATEPSRVRIYPKTAVLNALSTDPSGPNLTMRSSA